MEVIVLNGQSIFDIAVQYTGESYTAYDIAKANNMSVTDELETGQHIVVPESLVVNQQIVDYYTGNDIKPATATPIIERFIFLRIFGIEFPIEFK